MNYSANRGYRSKSLQGRLYLAIKEDLSWLGLDWDEEPGHAYAYGEPIQSKRFSIYEGIKKRWEAEDSIYPCFCSRARIHNISSAPHLGENKPVYDGHCRNLSWSERDKPTKSHLGESA